MDNATNISPAENSATEEQVSPPVEVGEGAVAQFGETGPSLTGFMTSLYGRVGRLEKALTTPEGLDELAREIEKRLVARFRQQGNL